MKKIFFLLIFLFLLMLDINLPFVGPYGNNNSTYSLQAKNYIRYGYLKTKFAPMVNPENNFPLKPKYYLNHPPLLQIALSVSYRIFGVNNWWPGRIVPALATIISLYLISKLAEILYSKKISLLVLIIACFIPTFLIYGKLIQFEPLLLPFILMATILFFNYTSKKKKSSLIYLIICMFIGFLIDWPMVFYSFILGAVYLWHEGFKKGIRISFLMFLCGIIFTLIYFYYVFLITNNSSFLISAYFGRSIWGPPFNLPNPIFSQIKILLLRFIIYFTPLSLISMIILLKNNIFNPKSFEDLRTKTKIALLFFPSIYVLAFPNGAWEHPYWLYYFIPITIFSTAEFLYFFYTNSSTNKIKFIILLVFILNAIFSLSVFNIKRFQTTKAAWQDNFINEITSLIEKDKNIGISWDFNDDFLRYKTGKNVTILWKREKLLEYLTINPLKWNHFVFACWTNCSETDKELGLDLLKIFKASYVEKNGKAILLDLNNKTDNDAKNINLFNDEASNNNIVNIYRQIRNKLSVEQI